MERIKCILDETKDCDNCGKCLEIKDFATIKIDRVYTDPDDYHEN